MRPSAANQMHFNWAIIRGGDVTAKSARFQTVQCSESFRAQLACKCEPSPCKTSVACLEGYPVEITWLWTCKTKRGIFVHNAPRFVWQNTKRTHQHSDIEYQLSSGGRGWSGLVFVATGPGHLAVIQSTMEIYSRAKCEAICATAKASSLDKCCGTTLGELPINK